MSFKYLMSPFKLSRSNTQRSRRRRQTKKGALCLEPLEGRLLLTVGGPVILGGDDLTDHGSAEVTIVALPGNGTTIAESEPNDGFPLLPGTGTTVVESEPNNGRTFIGTGNTVAEVEPNDDFISPQAGNGTSVPESEANDTFGTADAIVIGNDFTADITPAGDTDFVSFSAAAGQTISASTVVNTLQNATLRLLDTDGITELDIINSSTKNIVFTPSIAGTYFLQVEGSAGVPQGLPVNLTDGDGFLWDIQTDGNISNGTSDAYDGGMNLSGFGSFTTGLAEASGREVVIGPDATGDIEVTRKIFVSETFGFARFLEIVTNTGAASVNHTISISSNLGSDSSTVLVDTSSGDTTFTTADNWIVTDDDADGTGDPTLAHVVSGPGAAAPTTVSALADSLFYTYDLTLAPGETQIVMHFASQNSDRALALTKAADLTALGLDTLTGMTSQERTQVVNFDVPAGGGTGGATGSYTLELRGVDPINSMVIGDDFTGDISAVGDMDYVSFTGASGQTINARTVLGTLVDSELRLFDTDGTTQLAFDDSSGGGQASVFEFTLPADGTYFLQVIDTGNNSTGTYTLELRDTSLATFDSDPIVIGDDYAGDISPVGDLDYVSFVGTAGQRINATTVLGTLFDSELRLFDTDGITELAFDDDSGPGSASVIDFSLPADGTYFLEAREDGNISTGTYTLELREVGSPLVANMIAVGNDFMGEINPADESDFVSFTATAGQLIVANSVLGTLGSATINLYDTDGQTVLDSSVDFGGGGQVDFTAAAAGTYFLEVVSAGSGTYTVELRDGQLNGVLVDGWLYIQRALENIGPEVTRTDSDGSVAVLGSTDSTITSGNAGGAYHFAVPKAASSTPSLTGVVTFHDGVSGIDQFFIDLQAGAIHPSIIVSAGTGAENDLDFEEGTALENNATGIADFVNSGGGLLGHGSGQVAWGWLTTLIPEVTFPDDCDSSTLTLTPLGEAAFPGLTNENITSGPCHNHFVGHGLPVLARDAGGGGGTVTTMPGTGNTVDEAEPNDTAGAANLMVIGDDFSGAINASGDSDFVSFSATAGQTIAATTVLSGLGDSTLALYDTDGTSQLSFDDDGGSGLASLITFTFPDTGTYFLEVEGFGSSTGGYTLELREATVESSDSRDIIIGGVVTLGSFDLTPETATNFVGESHTVTATLEEGDPLAPVVGVPVTFTVNFGPNEGVAGTCSVNADCTTDANGQVSFTYVGVGGEGSDLIAAQYVDGDGNTQTSNTVQKTWVVAGLSLTKEADVTEVNAAGDVINYTITATNTGTAALTQHTISDPLLGSLVGPMESLNTDGMLEVGETWTFTGSYTVMASDIENNGIDDMGNPDGDGDIDNTVTLGFLETESQSASVPVPIVIPQATISDFVWDDVNGNGIQDSGEPGILDVDVNLLDASGTTELDHAHTDANGLYAFEVNPGTYIVEFLSPDGFVFSPQDQGTDDTADSDADPATGRTAPVTVSGVMVNDTIDAGLRIVIPQSTISDFVWDDLDRDGIQDDGEPGFEGVVVNLLDASGAFLQQEVTDANGLYSFTVDPGTYIVEFLPPDGFVFSPQDQGTDDTADSDVDPATGRTAPVTVASDEVNVPVGVGLQPESTITLDVQRGMTQRSFVRYVDVTFSDADPLAAIVNTIGDGNATNDRVQLRRFELDGSGPGDLVDLAGTVSDAADQIMFDFGAQGIGGNRNLPVGDGYYELAFDLDDDGTFETTKNFYRMFGDVTGDQVVNAADLIAVDGAMRSRGSFLEADANGDGRINHLDRILTRRAFGRMIGAGLPLDD